MSLGGWIASQVDIVGFLKGLFQRLYAFLFKDEIAAQQAQEKTVKAEEKTELATVEEDSKQIAALDAQKAPIQKQIAQEEKRQAADVVKIEEVKRAKEAKDVAINDQSAMDAFDAIHRSKP